jgi:preprotein translocase subunit SecE
MNFALNYFKGVWSELKKVSWPTKGEVISHTIIVLVSAIIAISMTSLADFGLTKLVEFLVQK